MSKGWKKRLTETWAQIDIDGAGVPNKVAVLKQYHANLNDRQRKAISKAMSQGKYEAGTVKAMEKARRVYRRALILVMMARQNSGNVDNDLARALQVLAANRGDFIAKERVVLELTNLPSAIAKMKQTGQVDINWGGWDTSKPRPLLAGCAIGRRGANGPGTLGCFVTQGNDVFILSNRHVIRQAGGAADDEILQPPHQLGGTFFDNIATFEAELVSHDAAIAKVHSGITCNNTTAEGRAITGVNAVGVNAPVTKRGVATGARNGTVTNAAAPNVPTAAGILQDQILITRDDLLDAMANEKFQVQGDSGSIVLNANDEVVALMHGQADAVTGQATHIAPILAHFNVQILVGTRVAP